MTVKTQTIQLQIIRPNGTETLNIEKSQFTIGRSDSSDVPIKVAELSREHLRITVEDHFIKIQDLNSLNGTFVENAKLDPTKKILFQENHTIAIGNTDLKFKLKLLLPEPEAILPNLSQLPKNDVDFKHMVQNAGLPWPASKQPNEQAHAIIQEAEYVKKSIIKNAEVIKNKTINEAKEYAKKVSEEAHEEYKKIVESMLSEARIKMQKLQADADTLINEKQAQAELDIKNARLEHEKTLKAEKERELELALKKQLADQESQIASFKSDLQRIKDQTKEQHDLLNKSIELKDSIETELNQKKELLGKENKAIEAAQKDLQIGKETLKKFETETNEFKKKIKSLQVEEEVILKQISAAKNEIKSLGDKKVKTEESINALAAKFEVENRKNTAKLDHEFKVLKQNETAQFETFKANQLKELQKVRENHAQSLGKFSQDIAEEITTKIEILFKNSKEETFNFDKYLEHVHSIIQLRSSTGQNQKENASFEDQVNGWQSKKKRQSLRLIATGFALGLGCLFSFNYIYKQLNTDPVKEEMAQLAAERQQRDLANVFTPEKVNTYFDNYVETTLYTDKFTETYLDDSVQKEWVRFASKYFLKQWQVDEEKVIQVISRSKSFVQYVNEFVPNLKKDRLRQDTAKLKATEAENIEYSSKILGTNVKYEAYKKLEKDFFTKKINQRTPANK